MVTDLQIRYYWGGREGFWVGHCHSHYEVAQTIDWKIHANQVLGGMFWYLSYNWLVTEYLWSAVEFPSTDAHSGKVIGCLVVWPASKWHNLVKAIVISQMPELWSTHIQIWSICHLYGRSPRIESFDTWFLRISQPDLNNRTRAILIVYFNMIFISKYVCLKLWCLSLAEEEMHS